MQIVGTDPDGHPIPGVPEPGDRIRILWAADVEEGMAQRWDGAFLIRLDPAGIWWTPDNDYSGAIWSPWSAVVSVEGPQPATEDQ